MNINPIFLVTEYIVGIVLCILGFFTFTYSANEFMPIIPISFGGCKESVFQGIFFGFPFGAWIGIIIFNKIKKIRLFSYILSSILALVISSSVGGILTLLLLDTLGGENIVLAPIVVVALAMFGFHLPQLFIKKNNSNYKITAQN